MALKRTPPRSKITMPEVHTLDRYVETFCDAPLTRKAVNDLSSHLARVVASQLRHTLPNVNIEVGHRSFGGSVRRHHLDIFSAPSQWGLQLGVDVKGLNSRSSLGKNWNNRVGDLHELAANHHLTFPRAVIGGVLAIPYDGVTTTLMSAIVAAMTRLCGRRAITDAANLLECTSLIVISKEERRIRDDVPAMDSPLRIERFADTMAQLYRERWQ
jgi:hypothetical protein